MKAVGQLEARPPAPELTEHIWDWFVELHGERESGFGLQSITRKHIAEWAAATGTRVEPWEARAIRALDVAFVNINQPASGE